MGGERGGAGGGALGGWLAQSSRLRKYIASVSSELLRCRFHVTTSVTAKPAASPTPALMTSASGATPPEAETEIWAYCPGANGFFQ